jgi:hypothetical protein
MVSLVIYHSSKPATNKAHSIKQTNSCLYELTFLHRFFSLHNSLFTVDFLQEPELIANVRSAEKDQTDEETGKIMFLLNRWFNDFSAQILLVYLIVIAYQHSFKLIFHYLCRYILAPSANP